MVYSKTQTTLIRSLFERHKALMIIIIHQQCDSGWPPVYIVTMLFVVLYVNNWCYTYMHVNFYCTVAAQEDDDPTIRTVHPDHQNVKLLCDLPKPSENDEVVGWIIGQSLPQGVSFLANGLVAGYSANIFNNNLVIRNIMMNDSRNDTWYQCVIGMQGDVMDRDSTMTLQPTEWGNATILYVAGECCSAE